MDNSTRPHLSEYRNNPVRDVKTIAIREKNKRISKWLDDFEDDKSTNKKNDADLEVRSIIS